MKITVAALMTTSWIARFLELPEAVTKIMIPGLCEGETDARAVSERAPERPRRFKALSAGRRAVTRPAR